MNVLVIPLVLLMQSAGDVPETPQPEEVVAEREIPEDVRRLGRLVFAGFDESVGWDQHAEYLISAIESVYEQNEWDSESDQYSLYMLGEVTAIPPWDLGGRMNAISGLVGDRYGLDEEQEARLQDTMYEQMGVMFRRHALELLPSTLEALQTRLAGEPFTAEQVARWIDASQPVFEDARQQVELVSWEFMQDLDDEQLDLAFADLEALNGRLDRIEELRAGWRRGQWQAADWGLESDPIQQGKGLAGAFGVEVAEEGAVGDAERPPIVVPTSKPVTSQPSTQPIEEEDPWHRYVREFIEHYDLKFDQQQRALAIYRDARDRRRLHERRLDQRLRTCRVSLSRNESPRLRATLLELEKTRTSAVELVFGHMKRRLEKLPTRAQRKKANEEEKATSQPTEKERGYEKERG